MENIMETIIEFFNNIQEYVQKFFDWLMSIFSKEE